MLSVKQALVLGLDPLRMVRKIPKEPTEGGSDKCKSFVNC